MSVAEPAGDRCGDQLCLRPLCGSQHCDCFSCTLPNVDHSRSQGAVCLGTCTKQRMQTGWEMPAWLQCWAKLTSNEANGPFPYCTLGFVWPSSLLPAKRDGCELCMYNLSSDCLWYTCAPARPGHLRTPQGLWNVLTELVHSCTGE